MSEGWDLVVNRRCFPKGLLEKQSSGQVHQHSRNNSSQQWEAANDGLAISVSVLVNRH